MPVCTRNGCKKEFKEEDNTDKACRYHPGGPVFHEGLKSWSCCSDVNKPELSFDEFMKIPGCQAGSHSTEAVKVEKKPAPTFSTTPTVHTAPEVKAEVNPRAPTTQVPPQKPPVHPPPPKEDEDDLDAPVTPGAKCRRKGCGVEFVSIEENRAGDGQGTVCVYHPGDPIFHEGSKGYLCCKRRVLEFDEFLKIPGCKKGRHCFIPKKSGDVKEVLTTCRIDHYQTPTDVIVSVFAKKADQIASKVDFDGQLVNLDIVLPESKRFRRTLNLYAPIIPEQCKCTFYGTKVELILRKQDNKAWNLLEQTQQDLGSYNITFGVGGRTGTIGAKAPILDEANRAQVKA